MNNSNKFFADRLLQMDSLSDELETALQTALFPSLAPDPNKALLDSTRQMMMAYAEWERKEANKQPSVEPMSKAEIDALAAIM